MKLINITTDFTTKSEDMDASFVTITGYANTTDKDRSGDVIIPEAWQKGGLIDYIKNPIVLAYHDRMQPIGMATEVSVDEKGLKITAKIHKAAGAVFELVSSGILKTFSVGFRLKDAEYDEASDTFIIKDVDLHEVSVVSIPDNQNSTFSVSKSLNDSTDLRNLKDKYKKGAPVATEAEKELELKELEAKTAANIEKLVNEKVTKALAAVAKPIEDKGKDNVSDGTDNKIKELEAIVAGMQKASEEAKVLKQKDLEKQIEDARVLELGTLKAEKEEAAAELKALKEQKMSFGKNSSVEVSDEEKDLAVLSGLIMGKKAVDTEFAKSFMTKAHLANMTADWETEFSTRMEMDIRQKLILEPMFRTVKMNAASMEIPINPEAGVGLWVPPGDFSTANSTGNASQTHTLLDTTLVAHKLVSREYIGYEEEEDAIIPLLPMIREAIVRRMARSSDIALLRGTGTIAAQPAHDPIKGLAAIAPAGAKSTISIAGANKVTIADLAVARKNLGTWGLNPANVVYIVSQDAYYDLISDPDYRTVDLVSNRATILTGQVTMVNGSAVVVSGEFEGKAAGKTAVVAVNRENFIVGNLRSMRVERDQIIVDQQNVIVTSRRMGFLDLITAKGVAVINWAA